jgi:N utilization substance protein B
LYQWQLSATGAAQIEAQFREDQDLSRADVEYFHELLEQLTARQAELEQALDPYLAIPPQGVDPVERGILLIGAYELMHRPDIPLRVIINEAVDLAKRFGAEQGHRFVNGVLDRLARQVRAEEITLP